MQAEQNYKNHTRFDPSFHYILVPLFAINFIVSILQAWRTFAAEPYYSIWRIIFAAALLGMLVMVRTYSLRVQDRVIRLEERRRLERLTGPVPPAHVQTLSLGQLVALRFASDEEAPALAARACSEHLTPKQIKESIRVWRPDALRV
jgi:hypothetical protein